MTVSIDCGNPSGALCYFLKGVYHYVKLPNDFKDLHMVLNLLKADRLIIEDITYIVNVAQKNKVKLIESYYRSLFCAESLDIEIVSMTPKQWQSQVGFNGKGLTYTARKTALWGIAQVIDSKVPKWACDALLLLSLD